MSGYGEAYTADTYEEKRWNLISQADIPTHVREYKEDCNFIVWGRTWIS